MSAPGEAEIELYVDPAGVFVEVEQQGPYGSIAPGESAAWKCQWLLRKLDPAAARSVGNAALLGQARTLASLVR